MHIDMIALRDGKIDYEDEQGNAILAPWMIPPDETNHHPKGGIMNSSLHVQPNNNNNIHHMNNNNTMMKGQSSCINGSGSGSSAVDHSHASPFIPSGQLHHPYGFIQYNTSGPAYVNDPRVSVCMVVWLYVWLFVCR